MANELDINWHSEPRMEAVRNVLAELDRYQGEEIVAGEHPLHKAVVALEDLVDVRKQAGMKQNLLLRDAMDCWFATLSASRPGMPNHPKDEPWYPMPRSDPDSLPALPELAKHWASRLRNELESWLTQEPERWRQRLQYCFGFDIEDKPTA